MALRRSSTMSVTDPLGAQSLGPVPMSPSCRPVAPSSGSSQKRFSIHLRQFVETGERQPPSATQGRQMLERIMAGAAGAIVAVLIISALTKCIALDLRPLRARRS